MDASTYDVALLRLPTSTMQRVQHALPCEICSLLSHKRYSVDRHLTRQCYCTSLHNMSFDVPGGFISVMPPIYPLDSMPSRSQELLQSTVSPAPLLGHAYSHPLDHEPRACRLRHLRAPVVKMLLALPTTIPQHKHTLYREIGHHPTKRRTRSLLDRCAAVLRAQALGHLISKRSVPERFADELQLVFILEFQGEGI